MSGRMQAAVMAILFGLIPGFFLGLSVVSGAVVALVTLRRGWQDGLPMLLWALLPAGLQWKLGDPSQAFVLVGVVIAALSLRRWQSWQVVILLMLAVGIGLQWSLPWQTSYLAKVKEAVEQLQRNGVQVQVLDNGKVVNATPEQVIEALLRYYGASQMLMMFGCMVLSRYWQALLYNPGGFRQEFHQLRLDWRLMVLMAALIAAGIYGISPLADWVFMLFMVPVVQGMAVVHYVVAHRNMGKAWLVLAYLLLLIAAPAFALLGLIDALANIRKRLDVTKENLKD
ncbi:MAG TPA: hypothetical protein VMH83_14370 [Candidatus Acidoferrum sp.]|nr:hypothetical protein [Candidatus Acidoferrum sp.]